MAKKAAAISNERMLVGKSGQYQGMGFEITNGLVLGTDPKICNVVFESDKVSGSHCIFSYRDEELMLTDLGSTCGTFVNGRRLAVNEQVAISDGDLIYLGDVDNSFQACLKLAGKPVKAGQNAIMQTNNVKRPSAFGIILRILLIILLVLIISVAIIVFLVAYKLGGAISTVLDITGNVSNSVSNLINTINSLLQ